MGATDRPPSWKVWVLATRPNTLTASLAPVLLGACATERQGGHKPALSLAFWLFAAFCQIGTNLHNDYADFIKGADTDKRKGQARATQKGWLQPWEVRTAATAAVAVQVLIGALLTAEMGRGSGAYYYMIFVTVTSAFNAFAYTGGEYPLGALGLGWVSIGYSGLGDLFVFLYFGIVATVTPFVLSTGAFPSALVCFAAFLMGCLGTSIIVVNNLRDHEEDATAGKRTMVVRLGTAFARWEYTALMFLPYAATAAAAALCWLRGGGCAGVPPYVFALPLPTLGLAAERVRSIWRLDGPKLNPYVGKSALVQLAFSALLAAGIAAA